MTTNNNDERLLAIKQAKKDSEISDLRQHADKMLRDFEDFNEYSSNRAIWELVQNACDLTIECDITIDYRHNKFSFSHNGRPFSTNALISLIKQVSGDKDENSEIPPVGKYGTGFLTTHSLGRRFTISSILQFGNQYVEISDFEIDRRAKRWQDLSAAIRDQKNKVFEIIDQGKMIDPHSFITTLTYFPESKTEQDYVDTSYIDLPVYIPFVLAVNDRLKSVKIISAKNQEWQFTLKSKDPVANDAGINLYRTIITINGKNEIIYSILDEPTEIEVILPIRKDLSVYTFSDRVARLFLYYPLIGSEKFGINFIINCKKFMPVEERTGIHLKSKKEQVQDQEEINRNLIEKASDLIFDFLASNSLPISNPLLFAEINFVRFSEDRELNGYFVELQESWIERFKNLPIVQTKRGPMAVSQIVLPNPELLKNDIYFNAIYYLLDLIYPNIPNKDVIVPWSNFVSNWGYTDVVFKENEDLVEFIATKSLGFFDSNMLKQYYSYLLEEKHDSLFTGKDLLPNIFGHFRPLGILRKAKKLTPRLLTIGETLIPESLAKIIDDDFAFDFTLSPFTRRDFTNAVNVEMENISNAEFCLTETARANIEESEDSEQGMDFGYFRELLNYCKLNSNLDSESKPVTLMKLISEYYSLNGDLVQIEPIKETEEDISLRGGQKRIVKIFFNTVTRNSKEWIKSHIELLYDILACKEDRYEDAFFSTEIYPNQNFEFCSRNSLKKDIDLDTDIIKLYQEVCGEDIKEILADRKFNDLLTENEIITNDDLGAKIQTVFFKSDVREINDHPFRLKIIETIKKLNLEFYAKLFPLLEENKAKIMLGIAMNERTKDDIFSLISLGEHQLQQLGKLIQKANFEQILVEAEKAIETKKENDSNWQHKYKIGTYIEGKIRERLGREIAEKIVVDKGRKIETEDMQGGQDIIIYYHGDPIYFIEVKSRWDSRNSVFMSKLQLERASLNFGNYALLCVDVTKYNGKNDKYLLQEHEILPLAKILTSIGKEITPLIENNLTAERDIKSNIKLVDYRGLINQEMINNGDDFEKFVSYLLHHLTNKIKLIKN